MKVSDTTIALHLVSFVCTCSRRDVTHLARGAVVAILVPDGSLGVVDTFDCEQWEDADLG